MRAPVEQVKDLSISDMKQNNASPPYFQLESFPHKDMQKSALIASFQPPQQPSTPISHVPCDIVLVIDVSGSMFSEAPVPGDTASEANGLSVLDLVKHAALTIIETMDERDRLSVVTFSSTVHVLQPLECMTDQNKEMARNNINSMKATDSTNLWQGLLTGLKQFQGVDSNGKVPVVMILTDGRPNHMCPPAGYVPKLRTKLPLPATIHTFGFGYCLNSGLLKSIAEIGKGNYSFIPDAGMIGTVFVHAMANLQNTYATDATLQLKYAQPTQIFEAMGQSVLGTEEEVIDAASETVGESSTRWNQKSIPLGDIQYGQSRDVLFRFHSPHLQDSWFGDRGSTPIVEATIKYKPVLSNEAGAYASVALERNLLQQSLMPQDKRAYHDSRAQVCSFLSRLFSVGRQEERITIEPEKMSEVRADLATLIDKLPSRNYSDALNKSLMRDLAGEAPEGQISIALSDEKDHFQRWGQHYLPSLLNAHSRQVCNSFKDPGPLQYGTSAPLFISCRDKLDEIFDNLPPPEPSRHKYEAESRGMQWTPAMTEAARNTTSMTQYHSATGVCFAGSSLVQLASGRSLEMKRIHRGMKVQTPLGSRKVAAVLRTPVRDETLCRVAGSSVLVTPWHPVSVDGKAWTFPAYRAEKAVRYTGAIYSLMLQRDRNPDAHAVRLDGGLWGVTLGHGLTSGGDARAHVFFGDYNAVGKSLLRLTVSPRGEFLGRGVGRDARNGLVCAFTKDASRGRALTSDERVKALLPP